MNAEPFDSTADAVIWAIQALRGRHEGGGSRTGLVGRPCDPDDIMKCLHRLFRRNLLHAGHLLVLRLVGERGYAPSSRDLRDGEERRLWDQMVRQLTPEFVRRGIVRGGARPAPSPAE